MCAAGDSTRCVVCETGYYLKGSSCLQVTTAELTLDYYVKTAPQVLYSTADLGLINSNDGLDPSR